MARSVYSEITPEMEALANLCVKNGKIDPELYAKYDVKRGLRDINGNGVLTGLTDISEIRSSRMENGVKIPCEGQLFYRGYSIEDLVRSMPSDHSFGFEVTAYSFSANCRIKNSLTGSSNSFRSTGHYPQISCATSS